jgi:hypothetical protein
MGPYDLIVNPDKRLGNDHERHARIQMEGAEIAGKLRRPAASASGMRRSPRS